MVFNTIDSMIVVQSYLLYLVLPLWITAGFVDWVLHRQTHIERTSGLKESLLHILQMIEVGLPALMAIFLQINALVILCMIIGFVLHEATGLWDVRYAGAYRHVSPFEQHVHSFLEVMPLIAGSLVIMLHMDQFLALWGLGNSPTDFSFKLKEVPLSGAYLSAIFCGIVVLVGIPYVEEVVRCYRFRGQCHQTEMRH